MKTDVLLIIIDMQNDFCRPEGALFVRGAEKDSAMLAKFIRKNENVIDHIILTQDYHQVIDISHPLFWEDSNGNPPSPFTFINTESIRKGFWKPRYYEEKAVEYIQNLELQGEFPHTIWPEHCIMGSHGAAITDEIMDPVRIWAGKGNFFEIITKGTNPLTEHFGALMANIPIEGSPETQLNTGLVRKLQLFGTILIAGEAKSHCVATTLKQMLNIAGIAQKTVLLEDCMSDIPGFETYAVPIYEKAKKEGVQFISSSEWNYYNF